METEIHERIINDRRTISVVDDDRCDGAGAGAYERMSGGRAFYTSFFRWAAKSNLEKLRVDLENENDRLRFVNKIKSTDGLAPL